MDRPPFQFFGTGVGLMAADYSQQYSHSPFPPALLGRLEQAAWGGAASSPPPRMAQPFGSRSWLSEGRATLCESLQVGPSNVSCVRQMPTVVELGLVMPERSLLRGHQTGGISGRRLGSWPPLHFSQPGSQVRLTWWERLPVEPVFAGLPNQGRLGSEEYI